MSPKSGYDDTTRVSERVIEKVATEVEKEPIELEPLYHSIAPECLDELFPATPDATGESVRQFTFSYEDHLVNVSHDGSVEVFPVGGDTPDLSQTDPTTSSVQGNPETPD